ncbi:MAG: hypothetical protein ACQCN4_08955 [Candidatus Bathyarchaeia archaeon]
MDKKPVVLLLLLLAATSSLTVIDTALGSSDSPANQSAPQAVADDTWTQKAPMPTARYDTRVAVVNNKIYCIGGRTGSSKEALVNVNEMYDPTTDTWTEKARQKTSGRLNSTVEGLGVPARERLVP